MAPIEIEDVSKMSHPSRNIGVLLILGITASITHAAEQGILRAISTDAAYITIDEGRYRAAPQLSINNLGTGLNELNYAVPGQPVRFTLDPQRRISELWLYPARADERQRLGINLGEDGQ
jgi:hypothetical protein